MKNIKNYLITESFESDFKSALALCHETSDKEGWKKNKGNIAEYVDNALYQLVNIILKPFESGKFDEKQENEFIKKIAENVQKEIDK